MARNAKLMGFAGEPRLRQRLCCAAARDVCALIPGRNFSLPLVAGEACLRAMQTQSSLLLTAHFHNWERMGGELIRRNVPLLSAALPLRQPAAERLLQHLRRRLGVKTVSQDVPRAALRHLEAGRCFALLWDQHAPRSPYEGTFFGLQVKMNPLPYFLLRRHPCPVFFGVPLPDGSWRLLPLLRTREKGWEKKLTRRYHRVLEVLIRRHPEYGYVFFHARFKNLAPYPGHRSTAPGFFSNLWNRKMFPSLPAPRMRP